MSWGSFLSPGLDPSAHLSVSMGNSHGLRFRPPKPMHGHHKNLIFYHIDLKGRRDTRVQSYLGNEVAESFWAHAFSRILGDERPQRQQP